MDNIQGKSMIQVNLRSLPCMGTVILCLVQAARPLCMQSPVRVISIVQAADESQSDRLEFHTGPWSNRECRKYCV